MRQHATTMQVHRYWPWKGAVSNEIAVYFAPSWDGPSFITLALITAARAGELLGLRWEHVTADALLFLETKNGKMRRTPRSPAIDAILESLPRVPG